MKVIATALSLLAISAAATPVLAQTINGPVQIVGVTSTIPNGNPNYPLSKIADGNHSSGQPFNGFQGQSGTLGSITFTLDKSYDITGSYLWNDINVQKEGVKSYRLKLYDAAGNLLAEEGHYSIEPGTSDSDYRTFAVVQNVRRIELIVESIHNLGINRVEIREVAFDGTPTAAASGKITIRKLTSPLDEQDFTYTGTGTGIPPTFMLDNWGAISGPPLPQRQEFFSSLAAGQYKFTEAQAPGWILTQINCPPDGPPHPSAVTNLANRSVTINLAAGQQIQCNFVSEKAARIKISKRASPKDKQDFKFEAKGGNINTNPNFLDETFGLDDDAGANGEDTILSDSKIFIVPSGTYTFTEGNTQGWGLSDINCMPNNPANITPNVPAGKVSVKVSVGQTVECVFFNKKRAVCKVNPIIDLFAGPNYPEVHICSGSQVTFRNSTPNALTVSPTTPLGWFTSIPLVPTAQGTTGAITAAPGTVLKYSGNAAIAPGKVIVD